MASRAYFASLPFRSGRASGISTLIPPFLSSSAWPDRFARLESVSRIASGQSSTKRQFGGATGLRRAADQSPGHNPSAPDVRIDVIVRRNAKPRGNFEAFAGAHALQDPATLHFGRDEWLRAQPIEIDFRILDQGRKARRTLELLECRNQQPLRPGRAGGDIVEPGTRGPERLADVHVTAHHRLGESS